MLRLIRNLIVILGLVVGIAFGFFNFEPVNIDLLFTNTQAPLVVLLVIVFVLGLLIAGLACMARIARLRGRLSSARRRLKDAEAEISNLRSMPIHDA
ncbi:lipopolysaccharide assembly protein LapA domain-containing protein [Salinisphaera aquimarina]|uniref:Lipopolysaccharide assembly protein LapA domain-containing protein n=1 Tax=Salinisphaera aquimarina TaxID=2094031 RepID=A0ABV7ESH2_9GAMM